MENKFECRSETRDGDSIQKVFSPTMENKLESGDGEFVQKEVAHFPGEIITQILVWLPVKSLLRFRCVSKSFCNLIDSPYFIKLHLNTSKNRTHLNLIFPQIQLISTNYNLAKLRVSDLDNELVDKTPAEKDAGKWPSIHVYGYCNGVFLVYVNTLLLALWNPSTQKHRFLPRCPFKSGSCPSPCNMGLGYDSTRDDYKVVLITTVGTSENRQGFHVWIFGLRSNSWRMVQTDFFPKEVYFLSFGHFAHGDLYWKCMLDEDDYYSQDIVAFDMATETFSLVAQPLYPTKGWLTGLQVLDGCLCHSFLSPQLGEAVLYVRKKDGVDFTWSILYSVTTAQLPPFLVIEHFKEVQVLGYSKEGDKIMLNLGFQYMISYDLKEKSFQTTTITCLISDDRFVEPCFESLVSVSDGDLKETIKTAAETGTGIETEP